MEEFQPTVPCWIVFGTLTAFGTSHLCNWTELNLDFEQATPKPSFRFFLATPRQTCWFFVGLCSSAWGQKLICGHFPSGIHPSVAWNCSQKQQSSYKASRWHPCVWVRHTQLLSRQSPEYFTKGLADQCEFFFFAKVGDLAIFGMVSIFILKLFIFYPFSLVVESQTLTLTGVIDACSSDDAVLGSLSDLLESFMCS